jgi:hypothetical protein
MAKSASRSRKAGARRGAKRVRSAARRTARKRAVKRLGTRAKPKAKRSAKARPARKRTLGRKRTVGRKRTLGRKRAAARKQTPTRKQALARRRSASRKKVAASRKRIAKTRARTATAQTQKKRTRPAVKKRGLPPRPDRASIPSSLELERHGSAVRTGREELLEHIQDHHETGPALTGGDIDANWESAYSTGDEAPGGDNPTPDQDIVDEIGRSLGVQYRSDEELKPVDKIEERDRHRWELDPASAEDYKRSR